MSLVVEVDFFNSYVVRKIRSQRSASFFCTNGTWWPGATRKGEYVFGETQEADNWYIEESRIRGGFNNVSTGQGVRAYLDDPFPLQQDRKATLIYSGIYNSRTGVNDTNVFSVGTDITKSLDPANGSIQFTYAEDTNLIVFQENRIHRALIDKDTIYTTESGTQTQAGAAVIGQFVPYKGEYGISKNPESFAIYNYRKYFADKNRNAIMRLSNDGLTEISMYGMMDWFRDNLAETDLATQAILQVTLSSIMNTGDMIVSVTSSEDTKVPQVGMLFRPIGSTEENVTITYVSVTGTNTYDIWLSKPIDVTQATGSVINLLISFKSEIIGGWDIYNKNYVISLQRYPNKINNFINIPEDSQYKTLIFDEKINGWVSFMNYKPDFMFSILNKFYTTIQSQVWEQYYNTNPYRTKFYNEIYDADITFVFNQSPSVMKNFKTISYEGSSGWEVEAFKSGTEGFDSLDTNWVEYEDDTTQIKSYYEGLYSDPITQQPKRAGFNRKENKYVANLISNSIARPDEVRFGADMTGIKGYFATVKIKTDETTDPGGIKELWSAGTEIVQTNGFQ